MLGYLHFFLFSGPFSDLLQLLVKTIFRLQEGENAGVTQEGTAADANLGRDNFRYDNDFVCCKNVRLSHTTYTMMHTWQVY